MKIEELNDIENKLIDKYRYEIEKTISGLSDIEFKELLIQRRFQSYAFTPLYDYGIDGLRDEKAKNILREIRNEEYPRNMPSHREDLVHDLKIIGLDIKEIINSDPTTETLKSIQNQLRFLMLDENQELHDIKVIAFLRFSLEVLVSAEYEIFIKYLKNFGLNKTNSRFYWPHYMHDMKNQPLGVEGKSHSDALSKILAEMLNDEKKIDYCKKILAESYELRLGALKQFNK